MKSIFVTAALALAFTGVAASAQDAPAQEAKEEKKICRTDKATGSLTRRTRICLTQAQWREYHARTKKGVDELQGSASGSQDIVNNPNAGGGVGF